MARTPQPLRDLYPRITSFPTLLVAFRKASKGKRYRPDMLAFAVNLEAELFKLQHELRSFSYAPGSYRQFLVREPKPRLVSAAAFRDRVVHHALIAVIGPPLERHFLPTSYANRRGYGSHRALRRFARACPGTLWLLALILANGASGGPAMDAFPGDTLLTPLERPRGLPIGNLTSQFLANLHLDALDHQLRALPGVRASLRYVDDLALFADQPEPLRQALQVLWQELVTLRLRPHPNKTHLHRTASGASFVGSVFKGARKSADKAPLTCATPPSKNEGPWPPNTLNRATQSRRNPDAAASAVLALRVDARRGHARRSAAPIPATPHQGIRAHGPVNRRTPPHTAADDRLGRWRSTGLDGRRGGEGSGSTSRQHAARTAHACASSATGTGAVVGIGNSLKNILGF